MFLRNTFTFCHVNVLFLSLLVENTRLFDDFKAQFLVKTVEHDPLPPRGLFVVEQFKSDFDGGMCKFQTKFPKGHVSLDIGFDPHICLTLNENVVSVHRLPSLVQVYSFSDSTLVESTKTWSEGKGHVVKRKRQVFRRG